MNTATGSSRKNTMARIFRGAGLVTLLAIMWTGLSRPESNPGLAIRAGRILTVSGGEVTNGLILIRDGKIAAIGKDISCPPGIRIIDAPDGTVCPGLIDSFTNLGTTGPGSEMPDDDEATSPLTPQLQITDSFNPDNEYIPLARQSGVTTVLTAPGEGNLLTGQSALIRLAGGGLAEMLIRFPAGVHGSLGELAKARYGAKQQLPSTRMGSAALLRQTFIQAREYLEKLIRYEQKKSAALAAAKTGQGTTAAEVEPPAQDQKLQALIPLLKGELPWIVRANRQDDIVTALRLADEFSLKLVINHGAEAWKLADRLAEKKIPVLAGPSGSYFQLNETADASFENAARLSRAGVKIAFQTGSARNFAGLLDEARRAVAHGLPAAEALKALTLYPAQIFGVDDQLGSLEPGKRADLVMFDGDPLAGTARVRMTVIGGQVFER